MYLPYLLKGRIGAKYYKHFLSDTEINTLEEKIITWVSQYEKYANLSYPPIPYCTSSAFLITDRYYYPCIHAFLHIPTDIRQNGPMVCFCGSLLPAINSRCKPYIALSRRLLHKSQISQIALKYGLTKELDFSYTSREISSKERVYSECESFLRNLSLHRYPSFYASIEPLTNLTIPVNSQIQRRDIICKFVFPWRVSQSCDTSPYQQFRPQISLLSAIFFQILAYVIGKLLEIMIPGPGSRFHKGNRFWNFMNPGSFSEDFISDIWIHVPVNDALVRYKGACGSPYHG